MRKIKKTLTYSFGGFIAFLSSKSIALGYGGPMPVYGIMPEPEYGVSFFGAEPTLWEKVLYIVLSPLFIIIIVVLSIIIGTIILIRRKRKNVK